MSYLNSGRDESGNYSLYVNDNGVVIKIYW